MKQFSQSLPQTKYIELNTKNCIACWKCTEACPKEVFGKVKVLWHKHIRIINRDNCIGCLKCTRVCTSEALIKIL